VPIRIYVPLKRPLIARWRRFVFLLVEQACVSPSAYLFVVLFNQ